MRLIYGTSAGHLFARSVPYRNTDYRFFTIFTRVFEKWVKNNVIQIFSEVIKKFSINLPTNFQSDHLT